MIRNILLLSGPLDRHLIPYPPKLISFLSLLSIMTLLLAISVLLKIDLNLNALIHSVHAELEQITVSASADVVPSVDPIRLQGDTNVAHVQIESALGTESRNVNNWITVNHDVYGTRSSPQTVINASNVAKLQLKWRLINDAEIQDPPIVIDGKGCIQD